MPEIPNRIYKYTLDCKNCGFESLEEQEFGKDRPSKATCPNCGCLADTKATAYNKNLKFTDIRYC